MKHVTRIPYVLLLTLVVMSGIPRSVFAEERPNCTENYMACLNDAGQLPTGFRESADVECAAAYVGCVVRKLKFW